VAPVKPVKPVKPAPSRVAAVPTPPVPHDVALDPDGGVDLPPGIAELLGLAGDAAYAVWGADADRVVADAVAFVRRRLTGDYEVDQFGLDRDLTESVILPLLRPLYEKWFRIEVKGAHNLPADGGALIVANHSGTIAVDAVMTAFAVHEQTPDNRILRMLGADFVFSLPFVSELSRKTGSTLACAEDAHRLLTTGELVGVWPEGFKGIGKPFSERYRLQRFGRGGFVSSAVSAGVPIIPTAIVGAEEIYPIIGNMPTVARLLGAPYFPVTPFFPWLGPLGLVPLPSKWIIEFGEPIPTDGLGPSVADDPMAVFNLGDQVRETIQSNLYQLLQERRSIFF
jgi:1-acyl-sn-glycerol-3-phosphate acyltransferase